MSDFNYLPFNKNFGYKSPISDDNICRTGTVKNDCISSFLKGYKNRTLPILVGLETNINIRKITYKKLVNIKVLF